MIVGVGATLVFVGARFLYLLCFAGAPERVVRRNVHPRSSRVRTSKGHDILG